MIGVMKLDTRSLDHGSKDDSRHSHYLEGHGDLVSRLIAPMAHIVSLLLPNTDPFTKSP